MSESPEVTVAGGPSPELESVVASREMILRLAAKNAALARVRNVEGDGPEGLGTLYGDNCRLTNAIGLCTPS